MTPLVSPRCLLFEAVSRRENQQSNRMKPRTFVCGSFFTICLLLAKSGVLAFSVHGIPSIRQLQASPATQLYFSTKRRRRKRKDDGSAPPPPNEPDDTSFAVLEQPSQLRNDQRGVTLEVQDILQQMPNAEPATSSTTPTTTSSSTTRIGSDPSIQSLVQNYAAESGDTKDPLAMLLADAKAMGDRESSSTTTTSSTLQSVISTLVTVDFFVVCALLVWFLTGIAFSAVLQDDRVQIAFNNIFEPIVQPALGILMIAALSDAVLKPKEEDSTAT